MNAHALLSAQGWRGTGHSLHKTDDSIGLAKPLLLNRKNNTKGLGQTQHFTSDQWWMNAFDEQLKGLDTSKEGQVIQTVKTGKLNALDRGALSKYSVYATFVRGGFLEGTITPELTDGSSVSDKSDENEAQSSATERTVTKAKETNKSEEELQHKKKKEEKKKKKEDQKKQREDTDQDKGQDKEKETEKDKDKGQKETKEEKRKRREAKRQRKEEKAQRKAARAARRERRAARRVKRVKKTEARSKGDAEEQKRRRRARKEEKRRLRKASET